MRNLVESILNKDYTKANDHLHEELKIIVARKLLEAKKMLAAKMSVGEQLNVDKRGNYDETGGRDVILSHEKQKRGLTEGNVAGVIKKEDATRYTAGKYRITAYPNKTTIHNTENNETHEIPGKSAQEQLIRHVEKGNKVEEFHAENLISNMKGVKKIDTTPVSKLKEEAKRAAMKSLQEKVRIRGPNEPPKPPLTARASRFSAALSGEEKPKPKVVKEQGPSKEDSETVGRMAQRAADETKVDNIIQRDADSAKVGELSKQEVKQNPPKEMPLSKPEERPGVVPRTTLSHPKFRSVR